MPLTYIIDQAKRIAFAVGSFLIRVSINKASAPRIDAQTIDFVGKDFKSVYHPDNLKAHS